jgi:hypothetical protein
VAAATAIMRERIAALEAENARLRGVAPAARTSEPAG